MNHGNADVVTPAWEPARPTLASVALLALWVVILALPMATGQWLASPSSDMYAAGYAYRAWGSAWWHRLGHVPLWNAELFGGLPFVAAGHGDIFYPTSFLRLVLPVATVVNLNFVVHYILAGLFTYWLLRRLHCSWTGSVIGALAYELSGVMASYPSPGHDGKLFACTALPLACLSLVMALRDKQWEGYAGLALAVALSLLGHFQIAYYVLIAAGLFGLYLTLEAHPEEALMRRGARLALALGAVLLGFGLGAIQILPFIHYIPFSPRAQGYYGFEGAASYAIPWVHVPEFFLKNFVGARETYWGSNPLKLHSEYLGLPVVALAVLGAAARERRRLIWWLGGIGLLFLLISLGASTPFYRLFWAVMPMVKKTRAPGMAFFAVAFVVALFAGFGAERLERHEGRKAVVPWFIISAVLALLALGGAFASMAVKLAGPRVDAALAAAPAITWGALGSALALMATAAAAFVALRDGLTPRLFALTLALVVGCDLWLNANHFWVYSPSPTRDLFRPDSVTERVRATPPPYRVVDLGVYPTGGVSLMAFDIPQLLGYPGNELRYFDDLWGGRNEWRNLGRLQLWDLYAIRYALLPANARFADSIPGFRRLLAAAPTAGGVAANLFERIAPGPYARVVPGAIKADSEAVIPTLLDRRMDYSRLVLFTKDAPVTPEPLKALPGPSPSQARVTAWEPGRVSVALDPAPAAPSYLLVAENWFPDWQARVDGRPTAVLRGDFTLLTVPVPAGARVVDFVFRSRDYETGKAVSLASLALLAILGVAPILARRGRHA
ncbi:MAG TPA: YfhO family protein [Gemmatimonadales bacterium]|nr:YfhO family protein [Gemmatimonadales bacterium]